MKTTHTVAHSFDRATLSLSSSGLAVTDTVSHDSVTVTGLSRVQIAKEVAWWLEFHTSSHEESERVDTLKALRKIQRAVTDAISKLSPETEEAAK